MKKDLIYIEYDLSEENKSKIIKDQKDLGNVYHGEANITEGNYLMFMPKEKWLDVEIRPQRNVFLQATDYLMLADNVERLTTKEYEDLKIYRQELRDMTELDNIIFPEKPDITF